MGDIHTWYVELLNIAAIGILVALIVSLNIYLTMQSIRDMSFARTKPILSGSTAQIDTNRKHHGN